MFQRLLLRILFTKTKKSLAGPSIMYYVNDPNHFRKWPRWLKHKRVPLLLRISSLSKGYILTHWGRVTHICVSKLTIIGSDNGLSPDRRQAIIWTNAGILLIGPLGTNFSEILIEIQTFSLKKIRLKMSSAKCCSFRLGLNKLTVNYISRNKHTITQLPDQRQRHNHQNKG